MIILCIRRAAFVPILLLYLTVAVRALMVVLMKTDGRSSSFSSSLLSAPPIQQLPKSSSSSSSSTNNRRSFLATTVGSAFALMKANPSHAQISDETDAFADTWWTEKSGDTTGTSTTIMTSQSQQQQQQQQPASDEVCFTIKKGDIQNQGGLGIELREIEFRTNVRVFVKSVKPSSPAGKLGIQKDWIVVSINGQSAERTNAQGVAQMLSNAIKDGKDDEIQFCFRDPSVFRSKLSSLSQDESITTQVAPAGDTTQRRSDGSIRQGYTETEQTDQKVTVTQLVAPKMCNRGATTDDLLEISYVGKVVETDTIFDGSAIKINDKDYIPGRGNDVSLFFVLGKQPFGQFPPGWDVGLVGMCVGERRRLLIPPALAYGSKGIPRRNIPPDATLQYDITLVSLNGLATPQ